jgi:signal transduction histidine kinase/CheY-like chemotaxis protein
MADLPPLRSRLLRLFAVTVLPLLTLAVVLALVVIRYEEAAYRTVATDRNRTFIAAVDSELRGHIRTLEAIAASPSLQQGDIRAFWDHSREILGTQPDWRNLILLSPTGQQLTNVRFRPEDRLPMDSAADLARDVAASGKPRFGAVGFGPVSGARGVPVAVPVRRDGAVTHVLQAILEPKTFHTLLAIQEYPKDWAVALIDGRRQIVARMPPTESLRVSSDFERALEGASEGWFRGRTLEGRDTFSAFRVSTWSGYGVGVAIPAATVHGASLRVALVLLLALAVSGATAAFLAYWSARRITRPMQALAGAAGAVGRGEARTAIDAAIGTAYFDEARQVAVALGQSAEAVRERADLLERERQALEAADRAKNEFLAMLGHELRNPLNAIAASAHVLRLSKPGAATGQSAHAVIERQTWQMTRMVEDLLDVSRIATGKLTLRRADLDLASVARTVVDAWQSGTPRRAGRIVLKAEPVWVNADHARLEQILTNLLDNAEKFSPEGSPITVTVATEGDEAVLCVADLGEGIDPQDLGRFFELFVQGPQSLDRPRGGIGLGLTLVKRLAELHGGRAEAASEGPGHGARFSIRLPRIAAPPARVAAVAVRPPARGGKVLLVEDDADGRAMMEALLGLQGHTVRSVGTGLAALDAVREWQPDAILVDIGLPDIDGYEVARRIRRSEHHDVKLVSISGYGQEEDLRRAYEAGFDVHLVKPIDPGFLHEVLSAMRSRVS